MGARPRIGGQQVAAGGRDLGALGGAVTGIVDQFEGAGKAIVEIGLGLVGQGIGVDLTLPGPGAFDLRAGDDQGNAPCLGVILDQLFQRGDPGRGRLAAIGNGGAGLADRIGAGTVGQK